MSSTEGVINHGIRPPLDLGLPYWFHLFFPDRALTTNLSILVIGCDDDLAVQLARANPRARIAALEPRPAARAAAAQTAGQQGLANLSLLDAWPDEPAGNDGFDLVYYNQTSWPGEPPQAALSAAARLLRLEGSLHLTLRARYAWSGVCVVRELFDTLAVRPDAAGYTRAREIVAALGPDHPWNLLGPDPHVRSDDLLADWLRVDDPGLSVPEIYGLLNASGLVLQRFTHQPYYLPQCSPLARTPLLAEVRRLPIEQQHALMELYWPGIRYHLAVACRADRPPETFQIDFGGGDWLLYAPLLPAKLPVEEDPAPLGAKARLCWRAPGMPEMAVSLGGFQHRLLRALDRAEELGDVVGVAGLSGDPQLRDEWARDFFQMMSDFDFLHFRICHSPRQPNETQPDETLPDETLREPAVPREPEEVWAGLGQLSGTQIEVRAPHDSSAAPETPPADMAGPDITGPDWAGPGIAGPGAHTVDASAPAPATPETATPEAATPEAERPVSAGQLTALEDESAVDMPALGMPAEEEPAASDLEPASLISLTDQTEGEPAPPTVDHLAAIEDLQADSGLLDDSGVLDDPGPPESETGEPPAPVPGPREAPATQMALPGEDLAAGPTRVPYEVCPLCAAEGYERLRQVETELLLQGRPLQVTVPWVRCSRCSHVFTNGYFAGEAWAQILKQSLRWRRTLRRAIAARPEASRIVAAIAILRESAKGRWLDVGCSESGLVAVAAEFGYDAAGVDCCSEAAERLASLGYSVTAGSLFDCMGETFDVVSLSNVVDRMPFPAQALSHLHKLLAPRGLLYVSARTSDSLRWRKLDAENANPNWGRIELYHVFQRKSLFRLLQSSGFEPCSYGASGSDGLGMEVIACRR